MEQALWENKLRNLLWLLRSAAPSSPLGSGLDDALARISADAKKADPEKETPSERA
jgi:hypothetical protein